MVEIQFYFEPITYIVLGSAGEESACNAGDLGDSGLNSGLGRSPGGVKWPPTPGFLPEKTHSIGRRAWWGTVQRVAKSWV